MHITFLQDAAFAMTVHFFVRTCLNTCIAWLVSIKANNWFFKIFFGGILFKKNKIENGD